MKLLRNKVNIWLISRHQDIERRARMHAQLQRFGLDYTHFRAIDGLEERDRLQVRADEHAYRRNMGSGLLPGKMGVYASHLAVWKALCGSSFDAGLIFEDDVILHDDFVEALDAALGTASHWDLIRFCCVRANLPISQGRIGRYRLNAYIGPFTGNAAYLVHKSVAARMLPRLWPQTRALDHELNRFDVHRYRLRGLEPFACHPDDGGISTITGNGFSLVRKPRWYKRLPYYRLKTGNYLRRASWLLCEGAIPGSRRTLG